MVNSCGRIHSLADLQRSGTEQLLTGYLQDGLVGAVYLQGV